MRKQPKIRAAAADKKSSRTFTKRITTVCVLSDIAVAVLGVAVGHAGTAELVKELAFGQAMFLFAYQAVGLMDHRIAKNLDGITSLVSAILGRRRTDA
ncbi:MULTISPECIES: hypothetical protein [unclassified Ensifer]|uniref:hypothetical protein n=1 Tax=unclassified Ensifer TaxID=2633371 RepID=UPI000812F66E|nr:MULTISPECIES: hypothetical protein [unclassified Ensifer]OCP07999.1 hypothetical protein BC362_10335 [Ensifer sp. LC14]OCP10891.1 hypothetical protein BC374_17630 [Ensifer sp. LC13]OCP11563.1 hypothetical protein BBX50_18225 [Ensifer sp. LC11]OCP33382.1 hypothetical protein BC364_17115 [Ensifer sp. LC499]